MEKAQIETNWIRLNDLLREVGNKTINTSSDYTEWDISKKRLLIESIFLRIPIDSIAVHNDDGGAYWTVIDGINRVNAIISFYNNEFDLESGNNYESWSNLNKNDFDDYQITLNYYTGGDDDFINYVRKVKNI